MARAKRSASPERKKKRKVVLVKAQAAAAAATERRATAKATAKVPQSRLKPAPIPGGTAGRILQWLGRPDLSSRPGSNTERVAEVTLSAPATSAQPRSRSPVRNAKGAAPSSSSSRSSSPSRSPSPIMAPAVVPAPPAAKETKRPKAASPKKVKKRVAPPAPAPSAPSAPAAKARKTKDGSRVAAPVVATVATAKAKKTDPAPVKSKKAAPDAKQSNAPPASAHAHFATPHSAAHLSHPSAHPSAQPAAELSELDQSGLQDAVLDRLRSLCDKDVDPKVLAEYIVVLAQMNKGSDHLSGELEAFFSDKALLDSFVRWVEESKWTFVPGGQPLKPVRLQPTKGAPQVDFWGPAPEANGRFSRALAKPVEAGPKTVRQGGCLKCTSFFLGVQGAHTPISVPSPVGFRFKEFGGSFHFSHQQSGPHVAVTSRVVLQPNPNFDTAPTSPPPKAPVSPVKAAVSRVPFNTPPPYTAEAQQVQLLGELTKTLQTILTKLQDRELPDSQRERYQNMADKLHSQIKTIKLPAARRR
ncbi:unnamed protein product [Effrenium voratum]|uniref:Uncharacterized protein n=1 Tax=Effrenium voratum TaxID=2562239 RepID=A0AA36MR25_9DINO|nr:unnamed protein product [Effrenium voratum]